MLKVPFRVQSIIKLYKPTYVVARDALQILPAGYTIPLTIVAMKKQCNNKGKGKKNTFKQAF